MSDPKEEATAPPAPASDGSQRTPPGPVPAQLDERQRTELLEGVGKGRGIHRTLQVLGLSYRAYANTCKADPHFAREVDAARKAADETLDEIGWLAAHEAAKADNGWARDILFRLWDRRDKARDLNAARSDRRREQAVDVRQKELDRALRLHLAEMEAEAKAKARAEKDGKDGGDDAGDLDLSRLTPEQLAKLRDLIASILPAGDDGGPGE